MPLRRIDLAAALALLGAALLFVSLFVDWFEGRNAFQAFEAIDVVLLAVVVAGAFAATGHLGRRDDNRPLLGIGLAAVVVVVVQLLEPPPVFPGDAAIDTGAWIGLVGSALLLLGGTLAMLQFHVTVDVRGRDARPRVAAADRREQAATTEAASRASAARDEREHPADSLFRDRDRGDGPERRVASASGPGEDVPAPRDVQDDDRTQPMRPLPPDDAGSEPAR